MTTPTTPPEDDPWWSRPGLAAVTALAGLLVFWSLTANGYANAWYADGALAASHSWHSLLLNSADLSNLVSLDKGPLPDWMMGVSGRVLGFGSFSLLLPDALCGIAAVVLLHGAVRRTLGHGAALLAALMLALSPVSVAMDRYDNPEALFNLLLVASAWGCVRALESGRLRHLLLSGACVGLAFECKMLEAALIVPGIAVAYLLAGRGEAWRRVGQLLCAGAVAAAVGIAWFAAMMLIPAGQRPFVDNTTHDSWFSLIFGYNGVSRLDGGPSHGVDVGFALERLFTGEAVGGQIGWLLPLALAGLLAGVWTTRRAAREDPRRAASLLFGLWALGGFVVFSFSQGIFHGYYTSSMAPAVAALAAAGSVALLNRARSTWGWTAALALALAVTAALSVLLLHDTPSFVPWLRPVVVVAGAVGVLGALARRAEIRRPRIAAVTLAAAAVATLAGPVAYCVATVGRGQADDFPAAGPGRQVDDDTANPSLVRYLTAHRDGARYLVGGADVDGAAPFALATGAPVITLGGFDGTTPAPTLTQLRRLIVGGELHYVMPAVGIVPALAPWVQSHCASVAVPGDPASTRGRGAVVRLHRPRSRAALLAYIRARTARAGWIYRCTPADARGAGG